jgi:GxxExxY protein
MFMTGHQQYVQQCKEPTVSAELNSIARKVVHAAYTVHSRLGPGLLESVYETCMAHELFKAGAIVQRQVVMPVVYDDLKFDEAYRLDLLVDGQLVVELKAIAKPAPVHVAQLLTYLKLSGCKLGLLCCFNAARIKDGLQRVIL